VASSLKSTGGIGRTGHYKIRATLPPINSSPQGGQSSGHCIRRTHRYLDPACTADPSEVGGGHDHERRSATPMRARKDIRVGDTVRVERAAISPGNRRAVAVSEGDPFACGSLPVRLERCQRGRVLHAPGSPSVGATQEPSSISHEGRLTSKGSGRKPGPTERARALLADLYRLTATTAHHECSLIALPAARGYRTQQNCFPDRFLMGLGIRQVGQHLAKVLRGNSDR
jgi:DNA ligase (NAD+)